MWICHDCGTKYGKPRGGVATYHNGQCQWCGKDKAVTEHRDYGYPQAPSISSVHNTKSSEHRHYGYPKPIKAKRNAK